MKFPPVDFSPPCAKHILPRPKDPDTASAPVWTCSGMITFVISAEHNSLQLNTAFFFFNPKKEENDIYCVCGMMDLYGLIK